MKTRDTNPSWMRNATKATSYTVVEIFNEKAPFITDTVHNAANAAKDIKDWVKRNDPFKPSSNSKETMIKQITNTAKQAFAGGKRDLLEGNLRFERLNAEYRNFTGANNDFDMDFGDDSDWGSFDDDESWGDGASVNEDYSPSGVNSQLSSDISNATGATLGAINESTAQMANATFAASEASTNRLIAAGLTNTTRLSSQISGLQGGVTTLNQNITLLVEQGNAASRFYGQAQTFMEHQEQTLNDIKSILSEMHTAVTGPKQGGGFNDNTPKFLQNGFDIKEYMKFIMSDSTLGMYASMMAGTAFKLLKLEAPSFIDTSMAMTPDTVNPLKMGLEKLLPALKSVTNLDNVFRNSVETIFSKLDKGEYGGIFNQLGLMGVGFSKSRKKSYYGSGYEQGTTTWTGKDSMALRSVIPEQLSSIEENVKLIATKLVGEKDYKKKYNNRLYDYENGEWLRMSSIRSKAQRDMDDIGQSAFANTIEKLEKVMTDNDDGRRLISELLSKVMTDENEESSKASAAQLVRILERYGVEGIPKTQVAAIFNQMTQDKRTARDNIGALRTAAVKNESVYRVIGNDLNSMRSRPAYKSKGQVEEEQLSRMTEDEKAAYLRQKAINDTKTGLGKKVEERFKDTGIGTIVKNFKEKGGVANQVIDFFSSNAAAMMTNFANGLNQYEKGSKYIKKDQIAIVHKGERVLTAEENRRRQSAKQYEGGDIDPTEVSINYGDKSYNSLADYSSKGKKPNKTPRAKIIGSGAKRFEQDVTNKEIARASTAEKKQEHMQQEMLDNVRQIAASGLASESSRENEDDAENRSALFEKIFGAKDENGNYSGAFGSEMANGIKDGSAFLKHLFTGEGYTTAQGVTIKENKEESIASAFKGMTKKITDSSLKTVLGDDYENSDFYKNTAGKYKKTSAAMKDIINGGTGLTDSDALRHIDPNRTLKVKVRRKGATTAINGEGTATPADLMEATNEAIFGAKDTDGISKVVDKVNEISNRVGNEKVDKIKKTLFGGTVGLAAGSIFGSSLGLIPSLFLPGGPIGGALLGSGIGFLSKNEKFMDTVFGKSEDGERIGGLISKDLQKTFKSVASKTLGGAALGTAAGIIAPGITSKIMGVLGTAFLGGGPVGGAIIGIGTSLLFKSKKFQEAIFGNEDGEGGLKDFSKKQKDIVKNYYQAHKDQINAMGLGGAAGLLIGGSTFGFGIPMVAMGLMGSGIGLGSITNTFKDFMFGHRTVDENGKIKLDENGKPIRDNTGFAGRLIRQLSVQVIRPFRDFADEMGDKFAEWLRYDIKEQAAEMLYPLKEAVSNMASGVKDVLHNTGEKIAKIMKKMISPLTNITAFLLEVTGKTAMGGLKLAGKGLFSLLSAPVTIGKKISNAVAMRFGSKERREADKTFRKENFIPLLSTKRFKDNQKGAWGAAKQAAAEAGANGGDLWTRLRAGGSSLFDRTTQSLGKFGLGGYRDQYIDARTKFAQENMLDGDKVFMGKANYFSHKGRKAEINKEADLRKGKTKLANKWGAADGWNDRINLSPEEAAKRNKQLKKLLGDEEYNKINGGNPLSQSQLMEFIYDPRGEKKAAAEKEKAEKDKHQLQLDDATINTEGNTLRTAEAIEKLAENSGPTKFNEEYTPHLIDSLVDMLGGLFPSVERRIKAKRDAAKKARVGNEAAAEWDNESQFSGAGFNSGGDDENYGDIEGLASNIVHAGVKQDDNGASVDPNSDMSTGQALKILAGHGLKKAGGKIVDGAGKVINAGGKVVNGTINVGGKVINGAGKVINAGGKVLGGTVKIGSKIVSGAGKLLGGAISLIPGAGKVIGSGINSGMESLSNFGSAVGSGISNGAKAVGNFGSAVGSKISTVAGKAKQLFSNEGLASHITRAGTSADDNDEKPTPVITELSEEERKRQDEANENNASIFSKGGLKKLGISLAVLAGGGLITYLITKAPEFFSKTLPTFFTETVPKFFNETLPTAWNFIKDEIWPTTKTLLSGISTAVGVSQDFVSDTISHFATGAGSDVMDGTDPMGTSTRTELDYLMSKAGVMSVTGADKKRDENNNFRLTPQDYLTSYMALMIKSYYGKYKSYPTKDQLSKFMSDHYAYSGTTAAKYYNAMISDPDINSEEQSLLGWTSSTWDYDQAMGYAKIGYTGTDEDISVGNGPGPSHFMQNDPRWRNKKYSYIGNGSYTTMANGGCGPTTLANVAVRNGIRVTPDKVANLAARSGFTAQGGSTAGLFNAGARTLGLSSRQIGRGNLRNVLSSGGNIVVAGKGNGLYTKAGHIISAHGIDRAGRVTVDDPLRKNAIKVPVSKLTKGMTNAWSIGRGPDTSEDQMKKRYMYTKQYSGLSDEEMAKMGIYNPDNPYDEYVDVATTEKLRSSEDYKQSTYVPGSEANAAVGVDTMHALTHTDATEGPSKSLIYSQIDPKWKNKPLNYESWTIGESGCVETALGSLLATITDIDFRPDFFTRVLGGRASKGDLLRLFGAAYPPSLQGYSVERYGIRANENGYLTNQRDSRFTNAFGISPNHYPTMDSTSSYINSLDSKISTSENIFADAMKNPFVIHGGTAVSSDVPDNGVFTRADGHKYSKHAMLVVPSSRNIDRGSGNEGSNAFYVSDPGSQNSVNYDRKFLFRDLFAPEQGIESMFFVGTKGQKLQLRGRDGKPTLNDTAWFNNLYGVNNSSMLASKINTDVSSYYKDTSNNSSSYKDTSNNSSSSVASTDEENKEKTIWDYLGELASGVAKIAGNMFKTLFGGGEYKSIFEDGYSTSGSSNGSSTGGSSSSTSTTSNPMSGLTLQEQYTLYQNAKMNSRMTDEQLAAEGIVNPYTLMSTDLNDPMVPNTNPVEFVNEGPLSFKDPGVAFAGTVAKSKLSNKYELASILEDSKRYGLAAPVSKKMWSSELYSTIFRDLRKFPDASAESMNKFIAANARAGSPFIGMGQTFVDAANYTGIDPRMILWQAALESGWGMDNTDAVRKGQLFGIGVYNDGTGTVRSCLNPDGSINYRNSIIDGATWVANNFIDGHSSYGLDPQCSLATMSYNQLGDFHVYGGEKYDWGRYARMLGPNLKKAQESIGMGPGAGASDSLNDSYFGYFDGNEAQSNVPDVNIDISPVSDRLDRLIQLLAIVARNVSGESGASTNSDNIGIGRGLSTSNKLRDIGVNTKEKIPVYEKENSGQTDKLRNIHNRIAKSPRMV